LSIMANVF